MIATAYVYHELLYCIYFTHLLSVDVPIAPITLREKNTLPPLLVVAGWMQLDLHECNDEFGYFIW
jgi:hypothetical protein